MEPRRGQPNRGCRPQSSPQRKSDCQTLQCGLHSYEQKISWWVVLFSCCTRKLLGDTSILVPPEGRSTHCSAFACGEDELGKLLHAYIYLRCQTQSTQ